MGFKACSDILLTVAWVLRLGLDFVDSCRGFKASSEILMQVRPSEIK